MPIWGSNLSNYAIFGLTDFIFSASIFVFNLKQCNYHVQFKRQSLVSVYNNHPQFNSLYTILTENQYSDNIPCHSVNRPSSFGDLQIDIVIYSTYVQPSSELSVISHFDINALIKTKPDEIQRFLNSVGSLLLKTTTQEGIIL